MDDFEKFNWLKTLGYGTLFWVIMSFFVWTLASFGLYDSLVSKTFIVVAAGTLSALFVENITLYRTPLTFFYGLAFVVIGMVLDLLISLQFTRVVFMTGTYWLSYAAILAGPMLNLKNRDSENPKVSRHSPTY